MFRVPGGVAEEDLENEIELSGSGEAKAGLCLGLLTQCTITLFPVRALVDRVTLLVLVHHLGLDEVDIRTTMDVSVINKSCKTPSNQSQRTVAFQEAVQRRDVRSAVSQWPAHHSEARHIIPIQRGDTVGQCKHNGRH